MHNIAEGTKVDCAIRPQTGSVAYNGEYFGMTKFAKALFIVHANGQLTGADMVMKVYEATDATGSDAQQLGADITLAQGIKLTMANIATTGSTLGETLVITPYTFIGGVATAGTALTFTAAAAEDISAREFNQASTTTAEAISLAACINDATYGVPGVLATVHDTDEVRLTMTEPGEGMFTLTESDAAELVVTDEIQQAHFEVAVQDMDRDDDFTHVQARLSGVDAADTVSVTLVRALAGYAPVGQVSAYYDDAK